MRLEDVLSQDALCDAEVVQAARERAAHDGRTTVAVLVDDGTLAEDALADALARAVDTVVIDVEAGALDGESVALLPESLARRHLALPVQTDPSGGALRVAFANPLDDEAIEVVGEATGLEVQPLVATVSGVRAAIDREYRAFDTRVIRSTGRSGAQDGDRDDARRRPSEVPSETTQRVEAGPARGEPAGPTTSPMHRIEHEATMEQRFEALVLALIDAGAIARADYVEALRRLMAGRDDDE